MRVQGGSLELVPKKPIKKRLISRRVRPKLGVRTPPKGVTWGQGRIGCGNTFFKSQIQCARNSRSPITERAKNETIFYHLQQQFGLVLVEKNAPAMGPQIWTCPKIPAAFRALFGTPQTDPIPEPGWTLRAHFLGPFSPV